MRRYLADLNNGCDCEHCDCCRRYAFELPLAGGPLAIFADIGGPLFAGLVSSLERREVLSWSRQKFRGVLAGDQENPHADKREPYR